MTTINGIMVSKYAPKKKNTGWVDVSQEPPTLKMFVNGRYVSVSGSSGIHYSNLSPTPMRDVTEEDLQKLPEPDEGFAFYKAIDLQDGIIPYFIIFDEFGDIMVESLYSVTGGEIRYIASVDGFDHFFYLSSDKKFMAMLEEEHKTTESDQEPGDGGNTGGGGGKVEGKQ